MRIIADYIKFSGNNLQNYKLDDDQNNYKKCGAELANFDGSYPKNKVHSNITSWKQYRQKHLEEMKIIQNTAKAIDDKNGEIHDKKYDQQE